MKKLNGAMISLVALYLMGDAVPALAANESQMMSMCNTYAARHLHVSTSDIASVKYEGQRSDGTHAVNGSTTSGQTFQCSFNKAGTRVVHWSHAAPKGCPADVSEANRYMYPDCD
jgi:hypothetical protein